MPADADTIEATPRERLFDIFRSPGGLGRAAAELAALVGCDEGTVYRARKAWEATKVEHRSIPLGQIQIHRGVQLRLSLDEKTIADYAALWADGAEFPDVDVVEEPDGGLILAHGHHRYLGASRAGVPEINARVHPGDRALALRIAALANAEQRGLRLSNADVKHKVMTLLDDPAWEALTDVEFARGCGCHRTTVARYRAERAAAKAGAFRVGADTEGQPYTNGVSHHDEGGLDPVPGGTPGGGDRPADAVVVDACGALPGVVDGEAGVVVEDVKGGPPRSQEESDREWLGGLTCRDRLDPRCRPIFEADALWWRTVAPIQVELGHRCSAARKAMDALPAWGAFYHRIVSTVGLPNPRHWLACAACRDQYNLSTGLVNRQKCQACFGRGYVVKGGT